ncbi:hypothetical protein HUU40_16655 [candidate division KSB1 bacterium]|nr:hypothetical protein [candidate division KSB1 bacterium]
MNQRDWLERNPEHKAWMREYGKAWRGEHPDYYKHYRRPSPRAAGRRAKRREHFLALLKLYQKHKAAQQRRRARAEQKILRDLRAHRRDARAFACT